MTFLLRLTINARTLLHCASFEKRQCGDNLSLLIGMKVLCNGRKKGRRCWDVAKLNFCNWDFYHLFCILGDLHHFSQQCSFWKKDFGVHKLRLLLKKHPCWLLSLKAHVDWSFVFPLFGVSNVLYCFVRSNMHIVGILGSLFCG